MAARTRRLWTLAEATQDLFWSKCFAAKPIGAASHVGAREFSAAFLSSKALTVTIKFQARAPIRCYISEFAIFEQWQYHYTSR